MLLFFVFGQVGFESFGKFATGEHDAPPASFTLESDIRAETRDSPFVGAAWVLFAEAQVVVEAQVREHVCKAEGRKMKDECNKHYIACLECKIS